MKRVCSSELLAEIGHYRNLLEQAGIACVVKHEQLCGGLGEIPFIDCLPELWVIRDEELPRATQLLEAQRADPGFVAPPWNCRACGQPNEGHFALCWSCGASFEDGTS